ncbi:hypothetical protein TNCV_843841 [Trichonephila clavipes]|nr:hypothetical protein TNCV_843841 [Trichonephila clavipes]
MWLTASAECMVGPRAPSAVTLAVQCTGNAYKRSVAVKFTPNHDTGCRTSLAMHNATVQQPVTMVSLNSNPTFVMLQAEAEFVSKHNRVPFCCQCPPFITLSVAQTPVKDNGHLADIPLCCKWYERTPNDDDA